MTEWQPIDTAPKDGREIIVGFDQATVWIVRNAWWDDGEFWKDYGAASREECEGWWSPTSSVGQELLTGIFTPTHWIPQPDPPEDEL